MPRLLITDKASSEVKGRMAELIQDLNVVINRVNFKTLKDNITENNKIHNDIAQENTDKEREQQEGEIKPPLSEDKILNELTMAERNLLLNDASQDTEPPLRRLVRTHNPLSYLSQHPQTDTSLGKLDRLGRSLDEYIGIKMSDTTKPRARDAYEKCL